MLVAHLRGRDAQSDYSIAMEITLQLVSFSRLNSRTFEQRKQCARCPESIVSYRWLKKVYDGGCVYVDQSLMRRVSGFRSRAWLLSNVTPNIPVLTVIPF